MKKTALITGGTKGIGKAVAERLLIENWNIVITYSVDDEVAKNTLQDFESLYPRVSIEVLKVDCGNLKSINTLENFLIKNSITLDAILFNAGTTDRASFEDMQIENWLRVFDVNVNFPVFLLQRIEKKLNDGASIVFTGSLMGIYPHSVSLSYGVTKSAVHALVKNLVKVFGSRKIRVNAIAPGFVDTDWQKRKPDEVRRSINNKIALKRFCDPVELADAFWFMISNNYINGEILTIDGGYSMS